MNTDDLIQKEIRKILKKHQEHGLRYAVDELSDLLLSKSDQKLERKEIEDYLTKAGLKA